VTGEPPPPPSPPLGEVHPYELPIINHPLHPPHTAGPHQHPRRPPKSSPPLNAAASPSTAVLSESWSATPCLASSTLRTGAPCEDLILAADEPTPPRPHDDHGRARARHCSRRPVGPGRQVMACSAIWPLRVAGRRAPWAVAPGRIRPVAPVKTFPISDFV
jgi:hypothetical protein